MFSSTHVVQFAPDEFLVHLHLTSFVQSFPTRGEADKFQIELETLLVLARGPLNASFVAQHGTPEALVAWLLKVLTFHEAAAWLHIQPV